MSQQTAQLPASALVERAPRSSSWIRFHRSLFVRLVAAFLIVSMLAISFISVVLTTRQTAALTNDTVVASLNIARVATSKVESWFDERHADLTSYAQLVLPQLDQPTLPAQLATLLATQADTYGLI